VLLGPRQAGKTTLALAEMARCKDAIYLDLELPSAQRQLGDPEAFLLEQLNRRVILDEVQRMPELFALLRGVIDIRRRGGETAGQFLLPGSATGVLLQQASESLAGRVVQLELTQQHQIGEFNESPLLMLTVSIQNTPHPTTTNFFIHRIGSKVGSIWPCNRTAVEVGFRKECGFSQCLEYARVRPIYQNGNINVAASSIVKGDRQSPFRKHAECSQTPWSGGNYSSGLMGFGNCFARHNFQSSINSSLCSLAHSRTMTRARRGNLPSITASV
jgi:hypothetical protein